MLSHPSFNDAGIPDPGTDEPIKNSAVGPPSVGRTFPRSRVMLAVVAPQLRPTCPYTWSQQRFHKKDITHDTISGYSNTYCDTWLIQLRSQNDMWAFISPVHGVY
ncbi:hypothetical protein TNCV_1544011 [Trichonephila clavipes]|nr:hypothetical protein TNCV_1544011 [Trichonephila clavipes]